MGKYEKMACRYELLNDKRKYAIKAKNGEFSSRCLLEDIFSLFFQPYPILYS